MKASLVTSLGLHIALAIAGTIVGPQLIRDEPPPPPVVIPVEFKIADVTSMRASMKEEKKVPDKDDENATKAAPAEAAPAAADTTETLPDKTPPPTDKPKEEKKEPPKQPPKRSDTKSARQQMNDSIEGMMKDLRKNKPVETPAQRNKSADLTNLDRNTPGSGKADADSQTFAVYFSNQMKQRQCWGDQRDMPDANRLRAAFKVRFSPDGRLNGEPEMVEPARQPAADRPMITFIQRALRAMRACEPFTIPQAYKTQNYPTIVLDFLPGPAN
jgi:outer membrane biosynthesis protein TonB